MSYKKSLLTAREESSRRLGRPYKFRGAIVDLDNNDEALKLNVPDLRDGLMTSPNKNKKTTDKPLSFIDRTMDFIVASNDSLAKLVSENPMRGEVEDIIASFDKDAGLSDVLSGEGTSTRALTIDGEPVNMLDKGDDVSIEINPKSKEGINNFISSLSMSESSNNSESIRTNRDGKQYAGFLNIGKAVQDQYMDATGAEFDMDAFRDDPVLQNKVALFHIKKLDKAISDIKNIPEKLNDINGLRAVGHLGGATGMKKFVKTNGKYNPKDELGTSLMDYFNKFSKKGV
tara:strand:+ start:1322 stop:2182 length:861 start_codon:yes stop_codon:yes gene_type:complete